MSEDSVHAANYILESILKDLNYLKDNKFLSQQVYKEVVSTLPSRITHTVTDNPPLPTRKSATPNTPPVPQPREVVSFPKLPVRRNNDWQPPQTTKTPSPALSNRTIMQAEPEKSAIAPPAYTQKPVDTNSLITVEALYDYNGEDTNTDLSFKQGNIIEVTEYVNDDWWKGTVNGKTGIFPQNHVKKIVVKQVKSWAPITAKPITSYAPINPTSGNYPVNLNPTSSSPYSYPPPPSAMYAPPPSSSYAPPSSSYGPPSQSSYGHPVPVIPVNNEQHEEGKDTKVSNMAKKFGGHVATAATWGFGATLGSQAANAIF
ncbi:hypothetical protein BDB01DRAFT_845282 [Pilobolus umbonatus]|nr:hypothetical protein BDB01DRAFT_845282 [Pilobolus umbonatus]